MSALVTRIPPCYSFSAKAACALALIITADWLFFFEDGGWTVGAFTLGALGVGAVFNRRLHWQAWAARAMVAAAAFAVVLLLSPSLLALALGMLSAALAVVFSQTGPVRDALAVARPLARLTWRSILGPAEDVRGWTAACNRGRKHGQGRLLRDLVVPLGGAVIFVTLFAAANPLVEQAFARFDVAAELAGLTIPRLLFWLMILVPIWSLLRPRSIRATKVRAVAPRQGKKLSLRSITLSLVVFNTLFAVENALDVAFLWSGAPLPPGVTLAEYAHRGAYPLVITALLAGAFVLLTLRPGSESAGRVATRRLVYLWIVQNVFLVASSVLRTADYVGAYGLTELRLAAFVWMTLVALGLVLILVRIAAQRSSAWLINVNALAAGFVLAASTVIDYGGTVAEWNLAHSEFAGGHVRLDEHYLRALGRSALVPLARAEAAANGDGRSRLTPFRNQIEARLRQSQSDWRGWTPRDAVRLAVVERIRADGAGREAR